MAESLLDAITGGLLGVAAGDALGATVEFMEPEEIEHEHGVHREIIGGGGFGWRPGQGTDDTDLTWAVICGYARRRRWCRKSSKASPGRSWSGSTRELDRHRRRNPPGLPCGNSASPATRSTSGLTEEASCGNGSLMRALPTALIRPDAQRRRAERRADLRDHPRPPPLCQQLRRLQRDRRRAHRQAPQASRGHQLKPKPSTLHPDVRAALDVSARHRRAADLSTTGYVIDSLRCAVWAIQQPDTLESVLVALANRGNDADTTAAIAGGLLGIIHGEAGIPQRWTQQLEYAPELVEAAAQIETIRVR